jgi:hypothetical protein
MDAPMKAGAILAVSFLALGAGGCAWMRGNAAPERTGAIGGTAATPAAVSFTEADLNGDARVTRREFDLWAAGKGRGHDAFDAADTNLNGVLTLDEWQAMENRPSAAAGVSRGPSAGAR